MSRQMKDSGIPWIGEIPSDWRLVLTSSLFHEHKEKNIGLKNKNLLSLSYGKIKRKDIETNEGLLPQSFETYNVIAKDDIVFRLTDLQNDKRSLRTGLCREDGIITSAYITLRKNTNLDSRYFHYLFHVYDICKVFYGLGDGVRQGMNYDDIRRVVIFMPPIEEQQRIADFLDLKCGEIDEMVSLQGQIIEELKAYKHAVITEAVTKSLNPNVPMNDSGMEWIGEIPSHWKLVSLRYIFNIKAGGDAKPEYYSDVFDAVHQYPVYTNTLDANQVYAYTSLPVFKGNSITVTGRGAVGHAIYRKNDYDAIIRLLSLSPKCDIDCRYYAYYIDNVLHIFTNNAAIAQLSAEQLSPYRVLLPPFTEQCAIADYLDKKCAEIDELIAIKQEKIEELKDYKKSIIYEYITGKKEVV